MNIQITKPYFRYSRHLPSEYSLPVHAIIVKKNSRQCKELLEKITKGKTDIDRTDDLIFETFHGGCNYNENLMISLTLDEGDYIIYTFVNYANSNLKVKEKDSCVISLSGSNFFDFHETGKVDDPTYNILTNIFSFYIKKLQDDGDLKTVKNVDISSNSGVEIIKIPNLLSTELTSVYFKNTTDKPKKVTL